jgi:hypothetical protein
MAAGHYTRNWWPAVSSWDSDRVFVPSRPECRPSGLSGGRRWNPERPRPSPPSPAANGDQCGDHGAKKTRNSLNYLSNRATPDRLAVSWIGFSGSLGPRVMIRPSGRSGRCHPTDANDSALSFSGRPPTRATRTAQNLNSGILP